MKKTLLKDTFREIKKTIGRFLAIMFIVALGTAFFVGVKTTCPDMKLTADKYYKDNSLMDFRLVSTFGFTGDDIDAIRATYGVNGIMPSYTIDAMAPFNDKQRVLAISSIIINDATYENPNYINRPIVISGRLPQKSGECAIEINKITNVTPNIGDKIVLSSGNDTDLNEKLKTLDYTVVGIIKSPIFVSNERGSTSIGNGQVSAFMIIPDIDFKFEYYNNVYLTSNISKDIQAYSTEYDNATEPLKNKLEDLSKTRQSLRYETIKSDAQNELSKKQAEYQDSLIQAETEFSDAQNKITENQQTLEDAKIKLAESKLDFENTIKDANEKINKGEVDLQSAQLEYNSKLDEFDTEKQRAIDAGAYNIYKDQLDIAEDQLDEAKKQIDEAYKSLDDNKQKLIESKEDGKKQLSDKQKELEDAQAELNQAKQDYETTKTDTYEKLADAKIKLDDASLQINDIPNVKWYVLDRKTNPGYVDYSNAADRMDAISKVFPVIFILVAILICLTSMGRMVEEQRQYMGTTKALGYNKSSIVTKFLLYAILATVLGNIIGLSIGFTVFPTTLNNAYSILYSMPKLILIFDVPFAVISFITGILVTTLTALLVSLGELNSSSAALMRPRAPKAGRKIFIEKIKFIWNNLKFSQKVTLRNIIRYKSRFFMTVIGVGGCCALLLVGFGLSDAITSIGDKQFNELYICQMSVNLKDNITSEEKNTIINAINEQPELTSMQSLLQKNIDIGNKNIEKSCYLMVPEDLKTIDKYINLRDRITHKKITLTDNGVVISEKLANQLGVKKGDTIYIKNTNDEKISVQVTDICEYYLLHFLYMSPSLYDKIYATQPEYNQFIIKLDSTDIIAQQNVSKNIVYLKGISSVNLVGDSIQRFTDIIKSIYSIVLVLIISAALLSFTVLFTLTNININERIREIATIKVLGFYDKEVSAYVFRENIILTILGTVLGLFIGIPLTQYVIGTAEVDMLMFGREIYPLSFVFAALFTLAFALIVNIAMISRLRKINMVEALKTVE